MGKEKSGGINSNGYGGGVRSSLLGLRRRHPTWTCKQLADLLDVSRQRVSEILVSEGMNPGRSVGQWYRVCADCGDRKKVKCERDSKYTRCAKCAGIYNKRNRAPILYRTEAA